MTNVATAVFDKCGYNSGVWCDKCGYDSFFWCDEYGYDSGVTSVVTTVV